MSTNEGSIVSLWRYPVKSMQGEEINASFVTEHGLFGARAQVRLAITGPCPRCLMTTLPQADLPRDPGILRTAAQQNGAHVGVYASLTQGGAIRQGYAIRVL